jgi:hypothetical protein
MDVPENIRILADSALLQLVREGVEAAKNWPTQVLEALSRRDYEAALAEFDEARTFAVAIDELTLRAERLDHETREGLLAAVHPLPDHLKSAKAFFVRLAPEIDRIRELEMYWKRNEEARKRDAEHGIVRINVTCFSKDAERIREFVKKVNAESKFDAVPRKIPGRPPKPGSPADLKRKAEAEAAAAAAAKSTPAPGFVDHETEISKWTVFRKPGGGAGEN